MKTGMLWFDNDPNVEIMAKVKRAIEYYRTKYGETPDLCFVHPSMVSDENIGSSNLTLRTNTSMIPHHFWIGVQKQPTALA